MEGHSHSNVFTHKMLAKNQNFIWLPIVFTNWFLILISTTQIIFNNGPTAMSKKISIPWDRPFQMVCFYKIWNKANLAGQIEVWVWIDENLLVAENLCLWLHNLKSRIRSGITWRESLSRNLTFLTFCVLSILFFIISFNSYLFSF